MQYENEVTVIMHEVKPDDLIKAIPLGESQTLEFKYRLPIEPIIGEVFAAFANTDGGILLIGIDDKGKILGLSEEEADHAIQRLKKVSSSMLPSPADTGTVVVKGKKIVYAQIDKVPSSHFPVMTAAARIMSRNMSHNIPSPIHILNRGHYKVKPEKKINLLIAMSFREEEEPSLVDYYHGIKRAAEATGLPIKLCRLDLLEGDYEISQKIMDEIDKAHIVLADFTLNARNVYFELGYARAKNRRVIQTARKGTVLEFDIRNWRTLFYRNATELEQKLIPELIDAYKHIMESTS
jgi:hypothetical protein